jgi:two-component system sensor histidine kinase/response regulator
MDVLIAHGGEAPPKGLAEILAGLGCWLREAKDGEEALASLVATDAPQVAVVEWDLGGIEGPELCRLVRAERGAGPPYIILLAGSDHRLAAGLEAGADDCVRMPADADELRARVNVGRRFAAFPWERVVPAAEGPAQRASERDVNVAPVLDAQRTPDDAGLADACGSRPGVKCELASVLVAR